MNIINEHFDIFIAYHGDDIYGSLPYAREIYQVLSNTSIQNHKLKVFLQPITNVDGQFSQTKIIIQNSSLLLLVATKDIPREEDGLHILSRDNTGKLKYLFEELEAFSVGNFYRLNPERASRLIACGDYNLANASLLHPIFNGRVNFNYENLINTDFKELKEWIKRSLDIIEPTTNMIVDTKKNELPFLNNITNEFSDYISLFEKSFEYLRSTVKKALLDNTFEELYNNYSLIFSLISTFEKRIDDSNIKIDNDNELFFDKIINEIYNCQSRNLLKIEGNNGTDKIFISQLIYVRLFFDAIKHKNNYLPFYISIRYYEKEALIVDDAYHTIEKKLITDIDLFKRISLKKAVRPIIILDGLKDYEIGEVDVEHLLFNLLDTIPNLNIVYCIDRNLLDNKSRIRLIKNYYELFINVATITPPVLNDQRFIDTICKIYKTTPQTLSSMYNCLQFESIDLYIFGLIIKQVLKNGLSENECIISLFEKICLDFLDGQKEKMILAGKMAFDLEYTNNQIYLRDIYQSTIYRLIYKNKSLFNYLIAYYYVYQLSHFSGDESINFFDMVLPKQITKFIIPQINRDPICQSKVIELGKNYNKLNIFGKSEVTLWLGRLEKNRYIDNAKYLLLDLYHQSKDKVKQTKNIRELTKELFLQRGIAVSLIYYGNDEVLIEYLNSLLDSDIANTINRGFHLEYYGDKKYNASIDELDFKDNIYVGSITMKNLENKIKLKLKERHVKSTAILDLFTYTSLLQARIEACDEEINRNIYPNVIECLKLVEIFNELEIIETGSKLSIYFKMIIDDFKLFINNINPFNDTINTLLSMDHLFRTGWTEVNIPRDNTETVASHMYSAWMIGMLFLPTQSELPLYDKNRILKMILIHDIAESITGDIPSPKKSNNSDYDTNENIVMRKLLLHGTYGKIENLSEYYDIWIEWYEGKSINARIAKDLDVIQLICKLCEYIKQYPDLFNEDVKAHWLRNIMKVKTDIGIAILDKLIYQNIEYKKLIN